MLKQIKLVRFKGFKRFTADLRAHSLLLGPNNAGKSTIINALRLGGAAARVCMRVRPKEAFRDKNRTVLGHYLSSIPDDGFDFANILHEFEPGESRLDLSFANGATIHMVWPEEEAAYFWLDDSGTTVTTAARAKELLDKVGLVPTLTPVDRQEKLLSKEHLISHVETRLSSRHFRNNLYAIKRDDPDGYRELIEYVQERSPEINSLDVEIANRDGGAYLDVYYRHPDSRVRKEIVWAGDGLQIWLQILFHLWRTKDQRAVILDEPDVFLHPDLQRRLIRVVEERSGQTVIASHSAEVAGEASSSALIWIDRSRARARMVSDDVQMEQLSAVLGSSFNLAIAKALRAKTALFVEGNDMKILRVLARKVGASKFAAELGIAIVPIGGFSHWPSVEAFAWIKSQFLGGSVKVRVLLDRDYRSNEECEALIARLAESSVLAHVWKRKEVESYLLEVPAVARVSGLNLEQTTQSMNLAVESTRSDVFGQFSKSMLARKPAGEDQATTFSRADALFNERWAGLDSKLALAPAKTVISAWNASANQSDARPISPAKLAQSIKFSELDEELVNFLLSVERDL